MVRASILAASLAIGGAAAAQLSSSAPERVRGDVVAVSGNTITVKTREGQTMTLKLADDARVSLAAKGDLSDVRDGTFIGTTAVPQPDGNLRAIEVHVFPDSMRGTGEGHRPWDLQPGSTMTNATVSAAGSSSTMTNATVSKMAGRKLTLKYSGGEKTVVLPPDVKVVRIEPADKSRLSPGAHLFAVASRQPDGTLRADRVIVGKDGLVPPM